MPHTMSLALVVAYYMYLKVAEEVLGQTWKDDNIVDFWTFCYLLSNHIIKYNLTYFKSSGDVNIIPATHHIQSLRERSKSDTRRKICRPSVEEFQRSDFAKKKPKKPSIADVKIRVCVVISYSYKYISIQQKQE